MVNPAQEPSKQVQAVTEVIASQKPASLVYCTAHAVPALEVLVEQGVEVTHIDRLEHLHANRRFDLGIVFDYLEHCSYAEGSQLLGQLRNLYCDNIWLAVTNSEVWNLNALVGFGFKRQKCWERSGAEICSYFYELKSYNHKREWNTPKYWANPQNWGKYWW